MGVIAGIPIDRLMHIKHTRLGEAVLNTRPPLLVTGLLAESLIDAAQSLLEMLHHELGPWPLQDLFKWRIDAVRRLDEPDLRI